MNAHTKGLNQGRGEGAVFSSVITMGALCAVAKSMIKTITNMAIKVTSGIMWKN